jgi:hypothetical protein
MPSPAIFTLHAHSDSAHTFNKRSPANRGSWPYVCNIDALLLPFSDECRELPVFSANCAAHHMQRRRYVELTTAALRGSPLYIWPTPCAILQGALAPENGP